MPLYKEPHPCTQCHDLVTEKKSNGTYYACCPKCREYFRERKNIQSEERQKRRICVNCGAPVEKINLHTGKPYTHCEKCRAVRNTRYPNRAKLLHKCVKCSADLQPEPDGSYKAICPKCCAKALTLLQKLRVQRKAEHKCTQCGKPINDFNPRTGGYYSQCKVCRAESNARVLKCKEKRKNNLKLFTKESVK